MGLEKLRGLRTNRDCMEIQKIQKFYPTSSNRHKKCEDRKKGGESRGDIGAIKEVLTLFFQKTPIITSKK